MADLNDMKRAREIAQVQGKRNGTISNLNAKSEANIHFVDGGSLKEGGVIRTHQLLKGGKNEPNMMLS